MKKYVSLLLIAPLVGCGGSGKEIPQDNICVFAGGEDAKACKPGQLGWFKPTSWGNEQMPLLVVATMCDFNHQVVMNNSGVICVITDKRVKALEQGEKKK
jgi:hypothetical protein